MPGRRPLTFLLRLLTFCVQNRERGLWFVDFFLCVTGFELCLTLLLLFMSVFTDFVAGTVNFVFVLNDVIRIDLLMLPSKEKRK